MADTSRWVTQLIHSPEAAVQTEQEDILYIILQQELLYTAAGILIQEADELCATQLAARVQVNHNIFYSIFFQHR